MDPSLIYTIDVASLSQHAAVLPRDAIRVATLFDGHRRLAEVLGDSFLTSRMTMSVFNRLRRMGIVALRAESETCLATTAKLPKMVVVTPPPEELPASNTVRVDMTALHSAVLAPAIQPAPEPVVIVRPEPDLAPEPRAEPAVTPVPTRAVDASDFDAADKDFFDSYVPEDDSADTFWDLEDCPRKQRAAKALQRRLNRGRGWLAQLLLT